MASEGTEGFQILSDFSHPQNLSLLIQAATDCEESQNQIAMHKILQKYIKLDSPYEVLEEAVQLAAKRSRSKVGGIVKATTSLELNESAFLRLLCNDVQLQLESNYRLFCTKQYSGLEVLTEVINTIKMMYSDEF